MKFKFTARPNDKEPWVWEVWDVTHPQESNHFVVATVDSKGASDDHHEQYAFLIARALNTLSY